MPSALLTLAPVMLAAATVPGGPACESARLTEAEARNGATIAIDPAPRGVWQRIVDAFNPPAENQVRIEQRLVIRIAPHSPSRDMLADLPPRSPPASYKSRKMGKCLQVAGIAGVQIDEDDRLLLYMRDRTLIGAELEKACAARDFYSGFYVQRSNDGMLCVGRDMLQSRTGASCSVTRLSQLIADD